MAQWQSKSAIGADLTTVDSTAEFNLGTIVSAEDTDTATDLGSGEFMYVKGVASVAAGDAVTISPTISGGLAVWTVARADGGDKGLIGIAMSAIVADTYGWVQVGGIATCNVASGFAAGNVCYLTGTDGTIDDAVVAGDLIYGTISVSAIATPAAGQAYVLLSRPFVTDASN